MFVLGRRNENLNISLIAKYCNEQLSLIKLFDNEVTTLQNWMVETPINIFLFSSIFLNEHTAFIFLLYQNSLKNFLVNLSTNNYSLSTITLTKPIISLEYFSPLDLIILIPSPISNILTTSTKSNELLIYKNINQSKLTNLENITLTYGGLNKYSPHDNFIFKLIVTVSLVDPIFVLLSLNNRTTFYHLQWCFLNYETSPSCSTLEVIYSRSIPSSNICYSVNLPLLQFIIGFNFTIQIYSQTGLIGSFDTSIISQSPIYGILSTYFEFQGNKMNKNIQHLKNQFLLSTINDLYFIELSLPYETNYSCSNTRNNTNLFELIHSMIVSKKTVSLDNNYFLEDYYNKNNDNDDNINTILPFYTQLTYIKNYSKRNSNKYDSILILGNHQNIESEFLLIELNEEKSQNKIKKLTKSISSNQQSFNQERNINLNLRPHQLSNVLSIASMNDFQESLKPHSFIGSIVDESNTLPSILFQFHLSAKLVTQNSFNLNIQLPIESIKIYPVNLLNQAKSVLLFLTSRLIEETSILIYNIQSSSSSYYSGTIEEISNKSIDFIIDQYSLLITEISDKFILQCTRQYFQLIDSKTFQRIPQQNNLFGYYSLSHTNLININQCIKIPSSSSSQNLTSSHTKNYFYFLIVVENKIIIYGVFDFIIREIFRKVFDYNICLIEGIDLYLNPLQSYILLAITSWNHNLIDLMIIQNTRNNVTNSWNICYQYQLHLSNTSTPQQFCFSHTIESSICYFNVSNSNNKLLIYQINLPTSNSLKDFVINENEPTTLNIIGGVYKIIKLNILNCLSSFLINGYQYDYVVFLYNKSQSWNIQQISISKNLRYNINLISMDMFNTNQSNLNEITLFWFENKSKELTDDDEKMITPTSTITSQEIVLNFGNLNLFLPYNNVNEGNLMTSSQFTSIDGKIIDMIILNTLIDNFILISYLVNPPENLSQNIINFTSNSYSSFSSYCSSKLSSKVSLYDLSNFCEIWSSNYSTNILISECPHPNQSITSLNESSFVIIDSNLKLQCYLIQRETEMNYIVECILIVELIEPIFLTPSKIQIDKLFLCSTTTMYIYEWNSNINLLNSSIILSNKVRSFDLISNQQLSQDSSPPITYVIDQIQNESETVIIYLSIAFCGIESWLYDFTTKSFQIIYFYSLTQAIYTQLIIINQNLTSQSKKLWGLERIKNQIHEIQQEKFDKISLNEKEKNQPIINCNSLLPSNFLKNQTTSNEIDLIALIQDRNGVWVFNSIGKYAFIQSKLKIFI